MQNGLYVSLSAQTSIESRLESIANNVANMNTPGYRAEGVAFSAQLARAGSDEVAYVSPATTHISTKAGLPTKTDNPLDVAVQGDGWMAISTPRGTAYTRDGRMRISETGALENLIGAGVLDAGGAPIILDPAAGVPAISGDGMITQNGRQVGAIGLFDLSNAKKLSRAEGSAVVPDVAPVPILDFSSNGIVQGSVEGSNVDPLMEISKLIEVTRTFDGVNTEVQQTESSLQDAIKTLGA